MKEITKHLSIVRGKPAGLSALCCTASLAILASTPAMADSIAFSQQSYSFNEVQGTVQLPVDYVSDYGGACTFEVPVQDFFDTGEGIIAGNAAADGTNR